LEVEKENQKRLSFNFQLISSNLLQKKENTFVFSFLI